MNFEEKLIERLKRVEREVERLRVWERPAGGSGVTDHGALTGLADNDHPQYLLTTGKAADSDKLDGIDSTGFATAGHDHDSDYLGITAKASDSDKLDNIDSTGFVQTSGNQTVGGIKTFTSIPALPATNPTTANQAMRKGFADATYLGISAKAADSDKLDGLDSTDFVKVSDPIGFWIAPGSFGTAGSWAAYGEESNYVPTLVNAATTNLATFISIPVAGKRLELTGVMTSDSTGNIDAWVELRYLQEAAGQPIPATLSGAMLFTVNSAYEIRKKTVTLDLSSYSAGATFALRFYRDGASAADTCSGIGYFFGISGKWVD